MLIAALELAERAGITEREDAVDAVPFRSKLVRAEAVSRELLAEHVECGVELELQDRIAAPDRFSRETIRATLARARHARDELRKPEQDRERDEHEREVGGGAAQRHAERPLSAVRPPVAAGSARKQRLAPSRTATSARRLARTARERLGAARVEAAARGRMRRRRHVAAQRARARRAAPDRPTAPPRAARACRDGAAASKTRSVSPSSTI